MKRKDFLHLSALSALAVYQPAQQSGFPIMLSTWDEGKNVNDAAWKFLENGNALDAVEAGGIYIEDTLNCCVGLGGYPDRDGIVTLDACIMEGNGNCGSVSALERIKHPLSVARKVMENTPHIMLSGSGAQQFAIANGFPLESGALSEPSKKVYEDWLRKSEYKPKIKIKKSGPFAPYYFDDGTLNHDTMGMIAISKNKKMAGAVTTSGLAFKMHGRVGDSPIIGAGLFVDDDAGAATSSGVGEEVIRICGTHLVVEFMRNGYSPMIACKKAVERIVKRNVSKAKEFQVGFLALNKNGQYGAYAIQKGFSYAIRSSTENRIAQADYYFK